MKFKIFVETDSQQLENKLNEWSDSFNLNGHRLSVETVKFKTVFKTSNRFYFVLIGYRWKSN